MRQFFRGKVREGLELTYESRDLGHHGGDKVDVAEGGNEVHHSVGGPDTSPQQHIGNGHLNSTQSNQINVNSRRSKKRNSFRWFCAEK